MSVLVGMPEQARPRGVPRALAAACALAGAIGVAAFAVGLATDATTTWRAFHVNYLYYAGMAQGGILLAAIFVLIGAQWPGPVRRIAESLGAWVPISLALFLVGSLGWDHVYPWIEHPVESKRAWLNVPRLFLTNLGILASLALLSVAFLYYSIRPTLGGAEPGEAPSGGLRARWAAGWQGAAAERERSDRALRRLAPVICLLYAVGFTVVGFDQVMSLSPYWFSNLFGGYFAWGGFLSAVAATALIAVLLRREPDFAAQIDSFRMHDLGKMIFAFSIFWMYLFWSQYLVIWYGNLPEETFFFEARLGSQFMQDKSGLNQMFLTDTWNWSLLWERLQEPYAKVTLTVWALCWIVPFWVLLGQRPKRTPAILGSVALLVCAGFWLERNVLVWPSLAPGDTWSWAGGIQFGLALGFLGAFVGVYLVFSRVFPALAVSRRS